MGKETIVGISLIIIDIFNLAEQFGIYFITKNESIDEIAQQRFFFILFAIGGATLFRSILFWSKLKVCFSMLIEIGEFVAYLILLPRTNNLYIVSSIFFAAEVILHLVNLYFTKSNLDDIDKGQCAKECCLLPMRILMYGFLYSSPMLFLFLDPDSKFRDTYYEILLILNIFLGVIYTDFMFEQCCASKSDSDSSSDEVISRIWMYIAAILCNIIAFIIMITTLVFAGQAIRKHATGEQTLIQYDFGVYIYCLVNYGSFACLQLSQCCALCNKLITQGKDK